MGLMADREKSVAYLRESANRKTLDRLLGRLGVRIDEVDLTNAGSLITAFFDVGDEFPAPVGISWAIAPDRITWLLIRRLLEREVDGATRSRYLRSAIEKTNGLYMPLMAVHFGATDSDKEKEKRQVPLLVPEDVAEAKALLLARIRKAAEEGTINRHPHLAYILYRWRELGSEEETRDWVRRLVGKKEGLLNFLVAFVHRNVATDLMQGGSQIRNSFDLKEIEIFSAIRTIQELLGRISLESLDVDERDVVTAFRNAVERPKKEDDM